MTIIETSNIDGLVWEWLCPHCGTHVIEKIKSPGPEADEEAKQKVLKVVQEHKEKHKIL